MRRLAVTLALCALAAGCAAPVDLRATEPAVTGTAPTPVDTTYRVLVTAMRKCYAPSAFVVQGDYFPETRQARVDVRIDGGATLRAAVDLEPAPAGTSIRVRYINPLGLASVDDEIRRSVVPWANGAAGYCLFDQRSS